MAHRPLTTPEQKRRRLLKKTILGSGIDLSPQAIERLRLARIRHVYQIVARSEMNVRHIVCEKDFHKIVDFLYENDLDFDMVGDPEVCLVREALVVFDATM